MSLAGHVLFFAALLLLTYWFEPGLLELGGGPGGGSGGEIITVGLSDQLSGGAGMVKPSLTPQPEAAPPPPPEKPEPEPEPVPEDIDPATLRAFGNASRHRANPVWIKRAGCQ